ncbi:SPX and EXS domain-containing protein 1 [Gossypium australe]|uniref:SPX and EXS domain-containing protein 1 n=1 Tax=Gossypium australe TaxID=47621 RepID=A0A5B6W246_9ROSI|nr:SPX and EXS domain-containing protein 1 [Gossypium australe]
MNANVYVILYVAVALVLIFPFDIFYFSSRYFLLRTLWRIALPLQASFYCSFLNFLFGYLSYQAAFAD